MKIRFLLSLCLLLTPGISRAQTVALPSFADLVERLSPSVVNISTTPRTDLPENGNAMLDGTAPLTNGIFGSGARPDTLHSVPDSFLTPKVISSPITMLSKTPPKSPLFCTTTPLWPP